MNITDERKAQEAALVANKRHIRQSEAHMIYELKPLLIGWLRFKLYMVFKKKEPGTRKSITKTIYGNEHSVTYKQCLHGKVDCIVLDRKKGYDGLVKYVEEELKGKLDSYKIYYDPTGDRSFPMVCRSWYRGNLEKAEDPGLTEEDVKVLYFTVAEGRLLIQEKKPVATASETADFKTIVADALK